MEPILNGFYSLSVQVFWGESLEQHSKIKIKNWWAELYVKLEWSHTLREGREMSAHSGNNGPHILT